MVPERLIARLADGSVHSGETLAAELGVTRAAVWKQVAQLAALGLEVERVRGRGYRLRTPIELLDATRILVVLGRTSRGLLQRLDVVGSVASTSSLLMTRDEEGVSAVLAEHQSAGRGRRGRNWVSPYGANLYLSVAWSFDNLPRGLGALSLAIGVGLVEHLDRLAVSGLTLKWPNDLWNAGRKLGGVLVELRGEAHGRTRAVVGVGLNLCMPPGAAQVIDQPWTDLGAVCGGSPPSRNVVAGACLEGVLETLHTFATQGFAPFAPRWSALDALQGRTVRFAAPDGERAGTAEGIDAEGALRVRTGAGLESVRSGEVQVRWQ